MQSLVTVPDGGTELDVLAALYRAAINKMKGGREQWIEGTLELASVVAKARARLPDHRGFSLWLQRNELEYLSPNDRAALIGFNKDLTAARKLLEQSASISFRVIWENRQKRTHIENDKGTLRHASGRVKRGGWSHRNRIPDVMRDDLPPPPPPPVRGAINLKALTPEQVDPDFKGTHLEFKTKYGHVNLHTKNEIEHHKQQEALMVWLGAMTDHAKTAQAVLGAITAVDQEALRAWINKSPAKAQKLKAWCEAISMAVTR